jgi:hypothetical protein
MACDVSTWHAHVAITVAVFRAQRTIKKYSSTMDLSILRQRWMTGPIPLMKAIIVCRGDIKGQYPLQSLD